MRLYIWIFLLDTKAAKSMRKTGNESSKQQHRCVKWSKVDLERGSLTQPNPFQIARFNFARNRARKVVFLRTVSRSGIDQGRSVGIGMERSKLFRGEKTSGLQISCSIVTLLYRATRAAIISPRTGQLDGIMAGIS